MDSSEVQNNSISVSEAMALAKSALESLTVKITGEISELSTNPRYKAVYFTIKDEKSSLPCMMWNNRFEACGVDLQIGALVDIVGRFSLYAAKGKMNFDVFSLELAGEGRLRQQVANLAKKLQAEGLMSAQHKKSIPTMPQNIGVITSPRGAAVYDVLRTLRRRFPISNVVFAGVTVEGKNAPKELIDALSVMELSEVDVILLVRGGGSFEDLMPFNDESLARKIFELSVPVVTGIGHEPDTSIADMVADLRASTPTAAAEAVTPSVSEVESLLSSFGYRLNSEIESEINSFKSILERISKYSVLSDPMRLVAQDALKLDDLYRRFPEPKTLFIQFEYALKDFASSLHALSPLEVLSRGYSIAKDVNGRVIKHSDQVNVGDSAFIQLNSGELTCSVVSKK